tara:strand:- start:2975 stop:4075 length:1101 start_codon:yes stop_codon:yes gene_type:complete
MDSIDIKFSEIRDILESNNKVEDAVIYYLLSNDILKNNLNTFLPDYYEAPITFPPTYKRHIITGNYDLIKKLCCTIVGRLPGYADRVLLKTHKEIGNDVYDSVPINGNDHYPVFYAFRVKNFSIAIITWNIGNGNVNDINPKRLDKEFKKFGYYTDIFIIGLQEVSKNLELKENLWKDIYNSVIKLKGRGIKARLSRLLGFGLETYIFWNNRNIFLSQVVSQRYIGGITKGIQNSKIIINRKDNSSLIITLGNVHAPFTESLNKYSTFLNNIDATLKELGKTDVTCLYGDLNSRCILRLSDLENKRVVKNIKECESNTDEKCRNKKLQILRYNYINSTEKSAIISDELSCSPSKNGGNISPQGFLE